MCECVCVCMCVHVCVCIVCMCMCECVCVCLCVCVCVCLCKEISFTIHTRSILKLYFVKIDTKSIIIYQRILQDSNEYRIK